MKKLKTSKSASENGTGEKSNGKNFLIVGIGASAGGIQALKDFFENVPVDSGVAYVVILHLSPDHESRLAEVLQTAAGIPVMQVNEKVKVAPNRVYVAPPNQHLEMNDGHIDVSPNLSVEERRAPIDIFFRTLAESHHAGAISVVLSGTGADGSMGLKRVKECGGVVFVQNPREAEFSEMPRNSIATNLVDAVLKASEIPAKIAAYRENLGAVEIHEAPEARPEDDQAALREIFAILRVRTGHDFSDYKHPTVLRRIERQINVRELQTLSDYAAFIRDAAETTEKVITSDEPVTRRLEEELERTKAQLCSSVEQYEIQTEELRASNEELQAINEELRSTAEELETSREELQSVNEELLTVNQELEIKIEELSVSNSDFKNLLNSTDIGTIFLDRGLRVKLFTPSVRDVFNLIEADLNRPLADITTKLNFADLQADVERVLETLQPVERELETDKGRWYLMRVFPYRTTEDKISGAVVTFYRHHNARPDRTRFTKSDAKPRAAAAHLRHDAFDHHRFRLHFRP